MADQFVADAKAAPAKTGAAPARAPLLIDAPAFDWSAAAHRVLGNAGNMVAGGLNRAANIGTTLIDIAHDKLGAPVAAVVPPNMKPDAPAPAYIPGPQRRQAVTQGLVQMGADPSSLQFKAGDLLTGVAGTSGVGGAVAAPVKAVAQAAPWLGRVFGPLANSIESGGFNLGSELPLWASVPTRIAGGAINGGATAGLGNPADAPKGAMIGGALPFGTQLAGGAGSMFRSAAPNLTPQMRASAQSAIDAGYVVPPATLNPTFVNKTLESISGKQATQQVASVQNNDVTVGLVRKALGLPDNAPLDRAALDGIRADAGKAYQAVASLPQAPAQQASGLMNTPAKAAVNPAQMLEDLKQARNDAQAYYTAYNRSANPEQLATARAAEAKAAQLESGLEDYATSQGRADLIPALRDARKRIAQSYTVQRALNDATGSINASVFGKLFQKGKPLSDGLDTVGQFAAAFPTVAKVPEKIGSPDTHNLKSIASLALGLGGHGAAGPLGLLAAAVPWMAPPAARSIMFSQPIQRGLLDDAAASVIDPGLGGLLTSAASRVAPLLPAQ